MIHLSKLTALALVSALLVAGFGVGSYYGAAYMAINDKLSWCYQWAHNHQWELSQPGYMDALQWCDNWHRERAW
jgi:hypothetical protein